MPRAGTMSNGSSPYGLNTLLSPLPAAQPLTSTKTAMAQTLGTERDQSNKPNMTSTSAPSPSPTNEDAPPAPPKRLFKTACGKMVEDEEMSSLLVLYATPEYQKAVEEQFDELPTIKAMREGLISPEDALNGYVGAEDEAESEEWEEALGVGGFRRLHYW